MKELIIAAYNRDLTWLNRLPSDVKTIVYRKGQQTGNVNEIFIEKNIGRCVHTFFSHIYNRYSDLSPFTFFVQDYPFDHWQNLIDCLSYTEEDFKNTATVQCGGYYGYVNFGSVLVQAQHVGVGSVLKCSHTGAPHHDGIDIVKYWKQLFDQEPPDYFEFNPGGHFVITKEHALLRSRDFYKLIINLLESEEIAPYAIERLENYIFNTAFKAII